MRLLPPFRRHDRDARRHSPLRAAWILAATLVAIAGLALATARITASDRVCAACHEMRPKVIAWQTSAHTRVACPACHETPRAWYAFPSTLFERAGMLSRDMAARNTARAEEASSTDGDVPSTLPDAVCLRCHDLSRVVTVRDGTLIDHNEHAARNKSCLSCHIDVGHPGSADKPLLLMSRCFACHGRTSSAKAPGTCNLCHPKSFDQRPASHDAGWRTAHGKLAKAGKGQCAMCHEKSFCGGCHRLEMPHPSSWLKGDPGHAAAGKRDWRVCTTCHGPGPDLCDSCHHKDYSPTSGSWRAQHPPVVYRRGSAFCMRCHDRAYCSFCHTSNSTPSAD